MPQPPVVVGLNAVIVAVTGEVPRALVVRRPPAGEALHALDPVEGGGELALPFGPLDPVGHRTLDRGLRAWVAEQTGFQLGYVEQLYTFGDRFRDPRERRGGARIISVAYLALVREQEPGGGGLWRDVYGFLPWEDWRQGRPDVLDDALREPLEAWVGRAETSALARARRERLQIAFGLAGTPWDPERVLERYELLYEAGLVEEERRDAAAAGEPKGSEDPPRAPIGLPMALDHRRMIATALGRLRGKVKYRPVVFELLAPTFTLSQLQGVAEALSGVPLHKGNFRRLVERGGLVEGTGRVDASTGGRPAELFRFRREVLRERPAPGVGLPGAIRTG